MPKRKSVKKIIKQKQKQSTKINITIDNSKKTTRRNTQQKPSNNNRYDSMPTYHMFYNPPPTPLIQSNKEENNPNPLSRKSVGSQTYKNQNSFETQTEPEPERHPIDTQTEAIPSSINFTTPSQENNLNSQVDLDSFSHPFSRYADLSARRKMTPQPYDELNTPTVKERVNLIERGFEVENPLKRSRGRPKKQAGDPKGTYNRKLPGTEQKLFESPDGNRRDTQQL